MELILKQYVIGKAECLLDQTALSCFGIIQLLNNTFANALLDRPMRAPWDSIYTKLVAEL